MKFKIIKRANRLFEIHQSFPSENSIRVIKVKSLNEFAKTLGDDEMGLASFNRARRIAKLGGKVEKLETPKEEPKAEEAETEGGFFGKKKKGKKKGKKQ